MKIYEERQKYMVHGKVIATDTAKHLLVTKGLRSQLYRQRSTLVPPMPVAAKNIPLEDKWTLTETGEPFLLIDDTCVDKRILVFGTIDNLIRDCKNEILFMDRTFKICPKLFIHSTTKNEVFPELYCLLPEKSTIPII